MNINTPQNQKVLTNVAVVKLKKGGKQFELACYRNKIANWRSKQESDLQQVIQIDQIFTNVVQGRKASDKDLKVFGNKMTRDEIFMEILNKGEYQVSDGERDLHLENLKKEVAHIIVDMSVNSNDMSSWPLSQIMKAMGECNVKLNEKQQAKKQALDIIKQLESVIPIKRARMRLLIVFDNDKQFKQFSDKFDEKFKGNFTKEIERSEGDQLSIQCTVEPHLFRGINDIFSASKQDKQFYFKCHVEILDQAIKKTDQINMGGPIENMGEQDITAGMGGVDFNDNLYQDPGMMGPQVDEFGNLNDFSDPMMDGRIYN